MEIETIILLAGVLVFAAHFFGWIFSFTKVPDVLLLMLVGVVVGPVLGLLTPAFFGESGALFSLVVLAIILFKGGTELRLDVLTRAWKGTTALVLLNFIATTLAVGGVVSAVAGFPLLLAFAFGAIVGGTSSAVVIPMLEGITASDEAEASLTIESAFTDVLSVVVATGLLAAHTAGELQLPSLIGGIILSFAGATIIGLIGGVVWSVLLHVIRHIENSIFTTPAFMLVLFGVAEWMGLSGPIAALAFGVTLGNIGFLKLYLERKHFLLHAILRPLALSDTERSFFSEIVFLLQTLFFVFVGISIPLSSSSVIIFAIAVTITIFVVRIPVTRITSPDTMAATDRKFIAAIVPKGLAATVLATLLVQQNITGAEYLRDTAYLVILLSVLGTSILVFLISKTPLSAVYEAFVGGPHNDTGKENIASSE